MALPTLTPINDALVEGDETVTLTLSDADAYDLGAQNLATVAIAPTFLTLQNVSVAAANNPNSFVFN